MANKKRRNKKLRRQQAAAAATTQAPLGQQGPGSAQGSASTPGSTAAAGAPQRQAPGYAAGVTGPRKGAAASTTTTIDIDARVPYFTSDLRRIAITAGLLIAVIIAASFFIR